MYKASRIFGYKKQMKVDAHETSISYHVVFDPGELKGLIEGGFLSRSEDIFEGRWLIWEEVMAAASILRLDNKELYRWKLAMIQSIDSSNNHSNYSSIDDLAIALSGYCTCVGECIHKKMLTLVNDYRKIPK